MQLFFPVCTLPFHLFIVFQTYKSYSFSEVVTLYGFCTHVMLRSLLPQKCIHINLCYFVTVIWSHFLHLNIQSNRSLLCSLLCVCSRGGLLPPSAHVPVARWSGRERALRWEASCRNGTVHRRPEGQVAAVLTAPSRQPWVQAGYSTAGADRQMWFCS